MDEEDDDLDLTLCHFDQRHTAERVPSTRILHYGPGDFMPACAECASFFEDTDPGSRQLLAFEDIYSKITNIRCD